MKLNFSDRIVDSTKLLTNEFSFKFKQLENISKLDPIKSMNWDEQYPVLLEQSELWGFKHIFIFNLNGMAYYAENNTIRDQSQDEYFSIISGDKRTISEPFVDDRISITTLSVPIKVDGKIVGTLCGAIDLENIHNIVADINVGVNGSAFILNQEGQFISNNDLDLVFNSGSVADFKNTGSSISILDIVKNKKTGVDTVNFSGNNMLFSYKPIENTNWSLMLAIPEAELLTGVNSLRIFQIIISLIFLVLAIIISLFVRRWISSEINKINRLSKELSDCNLSHTETADGNNEFSQVIESLNNSTSILMNTMSPVNKTSNKLLTTNENIDNIITSINEELNTSSKEVKNISDNMEESSASLLQLNANSQEVLENAELCVDKALKGLHLAESIEVNSSKIHSDTLNTKDSIEKIYNDCSKNLKNSLEKVKIISNVSEMSNLILEISEQTNLLALNASIESAKADEHGRGFAIVAEEIRLLAEQSSSAVNNIQSDLSNVLDAVHELSSSSTELLKVFETDIRESFETLINIAIEYKETGVSVKNMADEFNHISKDTSNSITEIVNTLTTLSDTVSDVAASSNNISQIILGIVEKSDTVTDMSNEGKTIAYELAQNIHKFKLDE